MGALARIVRVCSHPQSLAQCRQWLEEHLPGIEQVPVSSNAEGARRARDEKGSAAIAGETAAEVYGLKVLAANIEDQVHNVTRFAVIAEQSEKRTGRDKTTLMLRLSNQAGALSRAIAPFEKNGDFIHRPPRSAPCGNVTGSI